MAHNHQSNTLHDRLNLAIGDTSYRQIGSLTETHPETVRRYMNGHAPSATFLSNVARNFGISGEWLLTGNGPMRTRDIPSYVLGNSQPEIVMKALTQLLVSLNERVDQVDQRTSMKQESSLKFRAAPQEPAYQQKMQSKQCV